MRIEKTSLKKTLLTGCLLIISILCCTAQDSLYIYRNGQIIYRSQANQIDSITVRLPEYWDWKESDAVYQKIRSYTELSIFADMLEQTGYKDKLNDKTIWAPVNASFAGVDLSDGDLVRKLVMNHLSTNASGIDTNRIYPINTLMLSLKEIILSKTNGKIYLDGNPVIQSNIHVATSIIHTLNGYVPYRNNLWEYLYSAGNIDSMRTFLFSYNKKSYSSMIQDTVVENDLLTALHANLKWEFNNYNVLIPSDQVWKAAFDSLMSVYPPTTNQKLLAQQRTNAKLYLIKHLFLTNHLQTTLQDTMYTTLSSKINSIKEYFGDATLLATLSNGKCYSISKLNVPLTLRKGICIEAEDSTIRTMANCKISNRTLSSNPAFPISSNAYNYCFPLSTALIMKVSATYDINNLRPGKYNIYAQFVPAYAEDTTLLTPYKANFYLTFPDTAGVLVSNKLLLSNVVTNPKAMTKVLIQPNFVYNLLDPQINSSNSQSLRLKIENAARATESATLSREIRTDCILFEPVE
jgi:hypothetical protein